MNKFEQTTPQATPPTYDRIGLHNQEAGVKVPLSQAVVPGVLVTFLVMGIMIAADVYDPWVYIKVFFVALPGITLLVWAIGMRHWFTLTNFERLTGLDLNNDQQIGEPKPEPLLINIGEITPHKSYKQDNYNWTDIITKEQLSRFANGVINRKQPISRRTWTPKANGFSRDKWDAWQKMMIKAELIIAGAGDNFVLTPRGEKFFTYWADKIDAPLPHSDEEDSGD